jgi:hypothetical protein
VPAHRDDGLDVQLDAVADQVGRPGEEAQPQEGPGLLDPQVG